jgi:hypothetical protein
MPSSTFRFVPAEVAEMEAAALQVTSSIFPKSHVIDALTAKFNASTERAGMGDVKPKHIFLVSRTPIWAHAAGDLVSQPSLCTSEQGTQGQEGWPSGTEEDQPAPDRLLLQQG